MIPKVMAPPVETLFGSAALSFRIEAEAQLSGQDKDKATISQDPAVFSAYLVNNSPESRKQGDPIYEVSFIPQVDLNLGKVASGLGLSAYVEYESVFEKKAVTDDAGSIVSETWVPTRYTETYVDLIYAVNERLALVNSTQTTTGGFYGERWDNKARLQNLSMVSYTLF